MQAEQELFSHVEKAVSAVLNTKPGEITADSTFRGDLGAESIDMIDISFEIEKLTGKELDFKELVSFLKTSKGDDFKDIAIRDVVSFIQKMDA